MRLSHGALSHPRKQGASRAAAEKEIGAGRVPDGCKAKASPSKTQQRAYVRSPLQQAGFEPAGSAPLPHKQHKS